MTANSVHVMKMCEAFGDSGMPTVLYVPSRKHPTIQVANVFDFYGVEQNFTIARSRLIRRFPKGIVTYLFAALAGLSALRLQHCLIMTRDPVVALVLVLVRFPVVLELHEPLGPATPAARLLQAFAVYARKNFLRLVVITNPVKDYYLAQGCPEKKILVLSDAVNFKRYEACRPTSAAKDRYRIGYLGRFYAGRGIELILELARRDTGNEYCLYGGTPQDLQAWEARVAAMANVKLYPHVPNADVPATLRSIDILLMPYQRKVMVNNSASDTARGMSPMKMFEYMAAGRPIIASDLDVLKEVLTHNENCLLADPEDPDDWHAAIRLLTGQREMACRLARKAQEQVREQHTWEMRVQRILAAVTASEQNS